MLSSGHWLLNDDTSGCAINGLQYEISLKLLTYAVKRCTETPRFFKKKVTKATILTCSEAGLSS